METNIVKHQVTAINSTSILHSPRDSANILRKGSLEPKSTSSSQSISSTTNTSQTIDSQNNLISNNHDLTNQHDDGMVSDDEDKKTYTLRRASPIIISSLSSSSSIPSSPATHSSSSSNNIISTTSNNIMVSNPFNRVITESPQATTNNLVSKMALNEINESKTEATHSHEEPSQAQQPTKINDDRQEPSTSDHHNLTKIMDIVENNYQHVGVVGCSTDENRHERGLLDNENISNRLTALERLVRSSPIMLGGHSIGCEMLIDLFDAIYYECQNSELTRNKYQQKFLEIFHPFAKQINELKLQSKDFDLIKVIGFGNFGQVSVVKSRFDGSVYAMKTLNKVSMLRRAEQACYREERDILLHGKYHDCFTKLHYAFQDETNLYLIMDYYVGGDLLTLISKYDDFLPEEMSRFYTAEIIRAISVLHDMGYIHRDIKPDNILLDKNGHAKLADFGSCIKLSNVVWDGKCTIAVGTPDYISPDVLKALEGGSKPGPMYDFDVDWWSLGVVIFESLFGETPFYAESLAETYSRVTNHETCFKIPEEPKISDEAKDLIKNLICAKAKRFKTLEQFQSHPWFKNIDWDNLKNSTPPYQPNVSGPDDTSNFDTEEDINSNPLNPNKKYDIKNPKDRVLDIHLPFIGYTATFSDPSGQPMGDATSLQLHRDVIDGLYAGCPQAKKLESSCDVNQIEQLESDLTAARQQWCELSALINEIRKEKGTILNQLRSKESELEDNLEKMSDLRRSLASLEAARRQQSDEFARLNLELDRERNKGFTYQGEIAKLERRMQLLVESQSEIDLMSQQQSLNSESAKDELINHQKDYIAHMEEQLLKLQQQQPNWDNQVAVACKISDVDSDAAQVPENIYINSYQLENHKQQQQQNEIVQPHMEHSHSTTWQTRRSAKAERHEFNELQLTLQNELEEKRRIQNDLEDKKRELCQALSDLAELKIEFTCLKNELQSPKRTEPFHGNRTGQNHCQSMADNNNSMTRSLSITDHQMHENESNGPNIMSNRPLPLISQSMLFQNNNNSSYHHNTQHKQHQQHQAPSNSEQIEATPGMPSKQQSSFGLSQSGSNYQLVSNISNQSSSYFGSTTTTTEEGYSEADSAYRKISSHHNLSHQNPPHQRQQHQHQQPVPVPVPESSQTTGGPANNQSNSTLYYKSPNGSQGELTNNNTQSNTINNNHNNSAYINDNTSTRIYANREILERHHQLSSSLDNPSPRHIQNQQHHQFQLQLQLQFQLQQRQLQQQQKQQHQHDTLPTINNRHMFVVRTFIMPLKCNLCTSLMIGLIRQGLVCESCGFACHVLCAKVASASVPCPYDDRKLIGLDPQRGIGTAYSGYVRIPKPGGVRKGWMRIYVVVCDFKLFLYDLNGEVSSGNSSSVSLVGSSNGREDSSIGGRTNSCVSVSRIVDLRDENFSVTSVLENDVIHAARTDISCIFRLTSSMIGDERTTHTHRKFQYQLMLVDRESEKVKWIEALHELHRIIKRNNLPNRNLLTPYCMLSTAQLSQLRNIISVNCCALIEDGNKLLIGTDEALICSYLDLQVYHRLAKGNRVLQLDLLDSEQLIVCLCGRQKHTKLIPMRALENDSVAWIKMPETKNATTFVLHKDLPGSFISVAVKKSLFIYEITRRQLRYAPWREIHSNANIVSLNESGSFVCVGTYSNFHVHNILSRDGAPLYLINQDCDDLLYMIQNPFEPVACLNISPDKWLLVFENHGIYVNSLGYKTSDADLQFVTKCNAIATLKLDRQLITNNNYRSQDNYNQDQMDSTKSTNTKKIDSIKDSMNSCSSQSSTISSSASSSSSSLLLLVFSTYHIDVYDTARGDWLQTINLKHTKPLQSHAHRSLICITGCLDLPMIVEITAKSAPQFRLISESINQNEPFALKSSLVNKLNKINSVESTELQRKVSRVYISEPSNFQHIRHLGPSNQPCLIDLNNKNTN